MTDQKRQPVLSVTKKDLDITFYSGTGAGGQHRNKHQNCVRIKHSDSNVIVTASDSRSKDTNLKMAFTRLIEHKQFKSWMRIETARRLGELEEIEQDAPIHLNEDDLKIEKKVNGKWVPYD